MAVSVGDLAKRAVQGDRVAVGRLLMLYDARLRRRIGRKISVRREGTLAVEDVLQDAYAAAHRFVHRFEPRGQGSFYRWLAAIADRKLIDAVKALRI